MPKMNFTDPWHLTVVRTRGLVYLRPEKSWRPIVAVSVVDGGREHGSAHEVVLGSDGQNPNLKSVIPVHDVKYTTRLVIQVFHKSQTKKKHRKRNLVGSASVSLNEFLNKHPLPHPRPVEYDIQLSCPPPQRKSPTIGGKQQHSATLTMRFNVPHRGIAHVPRAYESPPNSPISEHHETDAGGMFSDGASSSKALSDTMVQSASETVAEAPSPWGQQLGPEKLDRSAGLRQRRKTHKHSHRVKGFHIDSDSDAYYPHSSSCSGSDDESSSPPTPLDEYFLPMIEEGPGCGECGDDAGEGDDGVVIAPCILPTHVDHVNVSVVSMRASLSFAEACLDTFAPYHELREAEEEGDCVKAEKVLGRLLTEWYVVGASLLALAGIDAAVFGFGSDAVFAVDGFSRRAVSIGAIAAGIGLVCDAWFLVLYSGGNVQKFQRLAKDVYNSYFFFCLTCRLPTVCMFLSALALMTFLLAVAWTAWPTAVLVMSFVAGFLLTSQFLVFGVHRFINLLVWTVRVCWRKVAGRARLDSAQGQAHGQGSVSRPGEEERVDMPVPSPSPAPPKMEMVWAEIHERGEEHDP